MHGATVNVDNLDTPEFMQFFENVASCVEPTANGGHIDIFAPIAACGELRGPRRVENAIPDNDGNQ